MKRNAYQVQIDRTGNDGEGTKPYKRLTKDIAATPPSPLRASLAFRAKVMVASSRSIPLPFGRAAGRQSFVLSHVLVSALLC
jgi:hypothetical protein